MYTTISQQTADELIQYLWPSDIHKKTCSEELALVSMIFEAAAYNSSSFK